MQPLTISQAAHYCGDRYWQQYQSIPLILLEKRERRWICQKPDGYRTTDIPAIDLSSTPVDQPRKTKANQPRTGQWLRDWENEQKTKEDL